MSVNADTLLDRSRLKRQATRWRIAALAALTLAGFVLAETYLDIPGNRDGVNVLGRDYIARLDVEGIIFDDPLRDEAIKKIAEDNKAKAVIVRIDSPGGTTVGGEMLYRQLHEIAAKKPVVAVMRGTAASAAYLTAVAAERIYAQEGTITGSIGVLMQSMEFTELSKKLGITPITIKSGPLKASPSPTEKLTPEAEAMVRETIMDFYEVFIAKIAEGRKMPIAEVKKLADGRVYTGRQAVANKLIDAIGDEDDAVSWLEKEKQIKPGLKIEKIEIKKEPTEWLESSSLLQWLGFTKAKIPESGLVSLWEPGLP
ncbi:MAG: signal peptide peptidase SppA [Alphaproteobacteria bacterium]|nr:signal peptide peptidase SppA [Alphaproteobacteria bacterium]